MFPLNRSYKWPFREPERDYPSDYHFREGRKKRFLNMSLQDQPSHYHFNGKRMKHFPNVSLPDHTSDFHLREGRDNYVSNMSISGNRYSYRPYSQGDRTGSQFNNIDDLQPYVSYNGMPPPGARNIRSYTLPSKQGARDQEPIWIVPPKKEPRLVTMEVKEPDPEPIMILPPPPPVQKVIEYEVPVKQKEPEPILVPMMPPPPKPQYVTVRQVVEEPGGNYPVPALPPPPPPPTTTVQRTGPIVTRLPDEYRRPKYAETLLGVRRTLLWELVLASFVLFAVMLLIAVFVAGFLS